jgi:hypothetical protein
MQINPADQSSTELAVRIENLMAVQKLCSQMVIDSCAMTKATPKMPEKALQTASSV